MRAWVRSVDCSRSPRLAWKFLEFSWKTSHSASGSPVGTRSSGSDRSAMTTSGEGMGNRVVAGGRRDSRVSERLWNPPQSPATARSKHVTEHQRLKSRDDRSNHGETERCDLGAREVDDQHALAHRPDPLDQHLEVARRVVRGEHWELVEPLHHARAEQKVR